MTKIPRSGVGSQKSFGSYLLAAMYLLVQNPIGSDLATPTRERKGLECRHCVDPAVIEDGRKATEGRKTSRKVL